SSQFKGHFPHSDTLRPADTSVDRGLGEEAGLPVDLRASDLHPHLQPDYVAVFMPAGSPGARRIKLTPP
ncbi:hypothetical protein, partial [Mycolicibacterium conceptionense]